MERNKQFDDEQMNRHRQENESENGRDMKMRDSGNDVNTGGHVQKHHEHHGNRRYESYRNHSSADDQPGTTDTNQNI